MKQINTSDKFNFYKFKYFNASTDAFTKSHYLVHIAKIEKKIKCQECKSDQESYFLPLT